MKVDIEAYDYVMFVDASGDDGFKFDKGSTSCYAAAALLVKKEDIQYNLDILNEIKKMVGCKPQDEVKYSAIRRHRRGAEACELLKSIKGRMSCYVVFKKESAVARNYPKGSKTMSVVCHLMALRALNSYRLPAGSKVLVVIDRMKSTEEEPLSDVISSDFFKAKELSYQVIFRDSKDEKFLLLQIADYLCGIIREHFEQYETNQDMLYFRQKCPPCKQIMILKSGATKNMCKNGKSRSSRIIYSQNLKNVIGLFPEKGPAFLDYFFTDPKEAMDWHFYMICHKKA